MTINTPMVSVPRELLERVSSAEIGMTAKKDQWAAAHELRALLAAPSEDVRAVVEEPVAFKLKECADGYGHGGRWCGPAYNCWLDPRDRKERDEDFQRRKDAASQRPVAMPERLREVWLFLDGQAELNGCVFGEKPEGRHNFWWRKELRAALEELYPHQ